MTRPKHLISPAEYEAMRAGYVAAGRSPVTCQPLEAEPEPTLDERAQRLGWADNAEMTHQAHSMPAFGCRYCHQPAEPCGLDECDCADYAN